MKILYVVPYAPSRIRVRSYEFVRALARSGHNVTLAALWGNDSERDDLAALSAQGVRVLSARLELVRSLLNCVRVVPLHIPFQAAYCWHPNLAKRLRAELESASYDVAQVEHLRGARFGLTIKQILKQSKGDFPIVWDSVDCISYLFSQTRVNNASRSGSITARLDLGRTERYEPWLVNQFDYTLVTSPVDQNAMQELVTRYQEGRKSDCILVLPNGLDLDYFRPMGLPRSQQTILFSGKMSYHANINAATFLVNEIMPLVWRDHPEARLQIVGKDPPVNIRALEERNPTRIEVIGYVKDMRPYLAHATVAVAPILYGAGIQNKVLEAMAMGTPVVATPTAVSALQIVPDQDLYVATSAEEFSSALTKLLYNVCLREPLGNNGRRYVEARHDLKTVTQKLVQIYSLSKA